jgi:hypothetical protein
MLIKALKIMAMLATVIGAVYAVISFYRPQKIAQNEQIITSVSSSVNEGHDGPPGEKKSATSNLNISSGAQIKQTSNGANSPNIISGGDVNIQGR